MSGDDVNKQSSFVTEATRNLNDLLVAKGLKTTLEYDDGHKHVDITLLNEHIFIEADGLHHFTDPLQIERDLKREQNSLKADLSMIFQKVTQADLN